MYKNIKTVLYHYSIHSIMIAITALPLETFAEEEKHL